MKHIKNRIDFVREFVDNDMNQDQDVKVVDLRNKLDEFNANKAKLVAILQSVEPKNWDIKASEVIGGNEFLSAWWKTVKADNNMKLTADELAKGSDNQDELVSLRAKADLAKKEMLMLKADMDKKIAAAKAEVSKVK